MSNKNISMTFEEFSHQRVLSLVITKTHTTIKYKHHELTYPKRLSISQVRNVLEKLESLEDTPEKSN